MHRLIPRGRAPIAFTFAYIVLFSVGFMYGSNYEFALYTIVMFAALALVMITLRHVDIPARMLWALSFMGMLHMAGGGVHVNGERLYGYLLFDMYSASERGLVLLRYDQMVHLVGYGVIAIIIHFLLRRTAPQMGSVTVSLLAILAAMAIGSLNELTEFIAVLMLPSTGVGNYFNTMLDMSFNALGATVGVAAHEGWLGLKKPRE
jgi:hypothetical protein